MEMHQVRYFLAVASTMNFTRAADECHVSQPSLSRAIKLLEAELGGDLFLRERPAAQLTMLGQQMLPLLRQCYDSATGARSLANAIRKREVGSLAMIFSRAVDLAIVAPRLAALQGQFERLQLKLFRGSGEEIAEALMNGDAELAITASLSDNWERLDRWPLFDEPFLFVASHAHRLANRSSVTLEDLSGERLVLRPYCDSTTVLLSILRERGIPVENCDEITSDDDLITLLSASTSGAVAPDSLPDRGQLARIPIADLEVRRTVCLYGVAGRQRTAAATAIMKMLRGAHWAGGFGETVRQGTGNAFPVDQARVAEVTSRT